MWWSFLLVILQILAPALGELLKKLIADTNTLPKPQKLAYQAEIRQVLKDEPDLGKLRNRLGNIAERIKAAKYSV